MSFTTYAGLTTNITNWLGRSDLTAYYDDWITLFEAYAARKLRNADSSQKSSALTTSGGSVVLPTDYLAWVSLYWNGSTASELDYVHPTIMHALYPEGSGTSNVPQSWTIEAGNIIVRPVTDSSNLQFLYYAKNTAAVSALNWVFNNHPDAYLWGALAEAGGYVDDPDRIMMWKSRRDEVMEEISKADFRQPGTFAMRVLGYTP